MSQANKLGHFARNLDVKEVCENYNSLETYDKVPIRKILIANIDPTTPHKLLLQTFKKFGNIVDCILKKQKQYDKKVKNEIEAQNQEQNQEEIEDSNIKKSYAFITYKTAEEAHRALEAGFRREISIKKQYLRVIPANSWNQPDNPDSHNKICYICKTEASEIDLDRTLPEGAYFRVEDEVPINQLNNDCLRCIFNFLPLIDRVRVERVCQRWKVISEEAWHDQRKLNFNPVNWGLKSTSQMYLKSTDACSVFKIFKKCCPFITHIDLSRHSNQLGNSILIELADMCSLIESINLNNFQFKHSGIRALAASCLNLKSIILGYTESKYKFDRELSLLFSRNKKLQKVDMDCFIIEGDCLRHLPKKSMQELTLRNANYVLRNGVYKVLERIPNLQVIKIIGIPAAFGQYREFIKSIYSCSKLEVLEIPTKRRSDSSNLSWNMLEPLTDLKNLTKINLKGNCALNDNFLMLLTEKCQNLTNVDISDCPHIRDPGLDSITSLPNLEYLCVDALNNVTDGVFLKTMPKIKTLLCSGCINFHSFGFSMLIESANKLEVLDLTNCTHIANDLVIDTIRRCKRTKWRCLKMYLKGTKARIAGINLRFHWNYLQLLNTERPEEEFLYYD